MSVILPQQSGRAAPLDRSSIVYSSISMLTGWRVLGWLGLAFLIMSAFDLAFIWYPARFGVPQWEFGALSATVAGLSTPALSLYLILASAIATERPKLVKTVGIVMVLLAVVLPALSILYLTTVPLALKATAANPAVHLGIKKGIVKSLALGAGYEILFVVGALQALRRRPAAQDV